MRRLALVPVVLAAAWLGGFGWFVHVATEPPVAPPHADGMVALTGGAERVETALHLLEDGRARRLLVSGVGGAAEFSELARRAGVDPHLQDRVTLGRQAASTRGNAEETAEWVRENDIHSLIVVTASYHMPRAMAELSRRLPGVRLYSAAVMPPALRSWYEPGVMRLLASEYSKWLAVQLGVTSLA